MALTQMFGISFRRPSLLLQGLLSPLGALILVVLTACGSASSPPAPAAPAFPPSPTDSLQGDGFGPLAVQDGLGGSEALGGTGLVRIEENCVTMTRENGDVLLLVWHSAEVTWNAESRTITYTSFGNRNDETVTIRDGDIITVGGESLVDDVPVDRNLTWLATPHPTCPGQPWAVFGVTKS